MEFKKDIDQIKQRINKKCENIPLDISDRALTLVLYYIETEIRKRGGGLDKDFTDKCYMLGKLAYKAKLTDINIKDQRITDDDIKRLRRQIAQSTCLKRIRDKRDFDL